MKSRLGAPRCTKGGSRSASSRRPAAAENAARQPFEVGRSPLLGRDSVIIKRARSEGLWRIIAAGRLETGGGRRRGSSFPAPGRSSRPSASLLTQRQTKCSSGSRLLPRKIVSTLFFFDN